MTEYIEHEIEEENGNLVTLRIPAKYEVCPRCRGVGTHDHPAFSGGFTAEDFAEDPDFREDYMRGTYDVTCQECGGKRVILVPDEALADPADLKDYQDHCRNMAELRAEELAERKAEHNAACRLMGSQDYWY